MDSDKPARGLHQVVHGKWQELIICRCVLWYINVGSFHSAFTCQAGQTLAPGCRYGKPAKGLPIIACFMIHQCRLIPFCFCLSRRPDACTGCRYGKPARGLPIIACFMTHQCTLIPFCFYTWHCQAGQRLTPGCRYDKTAKGLPISLPVLWFTNLYPNSILLLIVLGQSERRGMGVDIIGMWHAHRKHYDDNEKEMKK